MKKRVGYTLAEVIIVAVLLGLVISVSIGMLVTSLAGQKASYAEYDLQSNLRIAGMRLTNVINESTAVFTITEEDFVFDAEKPSNSTLSAEWDYYGILVEKDENGKTLRDKNGNLMGSKLVKYEWVPASGGSGGNHRMVLLADSGDNAKFSLNFFKPYNEDTGEARGQKFIGFNVCLVNNDGKGEPLYAISSELEAKNANQVVFRNTDYQKAVAIAVRSISNIEIDVNKQEHVTFVHMVFDVSGSMNFNIAGTNTSNNADKRITKLKNAAAAIIDKFAATPGVELVLYTFSTSANYEKSHNIGGSNKIFYSHPVFKNIAGWAAVDLNGTPVLDFAAAKTLVNELSAVGGTNIADAFRRVYHKIRFINTTYKEKYYKNATLHHYVIFLMDGQPTMICMYQKNTDDNPEVYYCRFIKNDSNYILNESDGYGGMVWDKDFSEFVYRRPQGNGSGNFQLLYGTYGSGIKNSYAQREAMVIYPELLDDSKPNKKLFNNSSVVQKLCVEKIYYIGFSANEADNAIIETIAKNSGLKKIKGSDKYTNGDVFLFSELGSNSELYDVFQSIAEDVLKSKWIIEGPGSK